MNSATSRPRTGLTPARTGRLAAVVAAALLVSVSVMNQSSSAFSASTDKKTATWTAGTMELKASEGGQLNVAAMIPGESISTCVTLTYTGTVPEEKLNPVQLRGTASGPLLAYVRFDGGVVDSCDSKASAKPFFPQGTLADDGAKAIFTAGYPTPWTPSQSGQTRSFRLSATLPADTPSAAKGKAGSVEFAWDLQSKPGKAS